jgi:hypothetical protein
MGKDFGGGSLPAVLSVPETRAERAAGIKGLSGSDEDSGDVNKRRRTARASVDGAGKTFWDSRHIPLGR